MFDRNVVDLTACYIHPLTSQDYTTMAGGIAEAIADVQARIKQVIDQSGATQEV